MFVNDEFILKYKEATRILPKKRGWCITGVGEPGGELVDELAKADVHLERATTSRVIAIDEDGPHHRRLGQTAAAVRRRCVLGAVPVLLLLLLLVKTVSRLVARIFRGRRGRRAALLLLLSLYTWSDSDVILIATVNAAMLEVCRLQQCGVLNLCVKLNASRNARLQTTLE